MFCDKNHEAMLRYRLLAEVTEGIPFYFTFSESAFEKYSIGQECQLVMFKKFGNGRSDHYDQNFFLETMYYFVNRNRYPTIIPLNGKYLKYVFYEKDPVLITFFKPGDEVSNRLHEQLQLASVDLKGRIKISGGEVHTQYSVNVRSSLGLKHLKAPFICIFQKGEHR